MTNFKIGVTSFRSIYISLDRNVELDTKRKEEARVIANYLIDNCSLFLEAREHCKKDIFYEGVYDGETSKFSIFAITKDDEPLKGEQFDNELGWVGFNAS